MKQTGTILTTALLAAVFTPTPSRADVLLREEFDGYTAGSIIDQDGQGTGLAGFWTQPRTDGSYSVGPGLSGDNGLVISSSGRNDARVDHGVTEWGTGQLWMSFLYNETRYGGHFYVSGGGGFNGGAGHPWSNGTFGLHNQNGPGNTPYSANQTYRLVTFIDWDAGTTTLWIDPDPENMPVTDPTDLDFAPSSHKEEVPDATTALYITSWGDGIVDDIIIGTEYEDVAIAIPGDPPAVPDPVMPTDGATGVLPDTALQWTPNGSTSYDVFLWKDGETIPDAPEATVTDPSYQPDTLDPLTTYMWQVDSFNDNGSTTGTPWTFTTGDGVVALLPPDGVTDVPVDLPLEWSASGATSWDVFLWIDGETKPTTPTATVSTPRHETGGLTTSTIYRWEVVSHYDDGSSTTSATWSFTTSDGVPGTLLLHEEFDGYSAGSIIGQTGKGTGLDGTWEFQGTEGTMQLGAGLSGDYGLVVTAQAGLDAKIAHTVEGWGTGVFYMSYLWNEAQYGPGHFYVSGGGSFAGAFGHGWSTSWQIDNVGNGVAYNPDQTYRLVARIDFDANETTMWADPVYEFDAPVAVKPVEQSEPATLIIRSHATDGTIDDIRIGTDFASVIEVLPTAGIELAIARSGTDLVFTWTSTSDQIYDLVASTTLETDPATWDAVEGATAIPAGPDGMTEWTIPFPGDAVMFYAVRGYDPPPVLEEDFEGDNGGFTYVDGSAGSGTAWEWGKPDSDSGFFSVVTEGNGGSLKCWATNLGDVAGTGDAGFYNDTTDAALQSPVIDLTGVTAATLTFAHAMDVITGDTAVVNFLDVDNADAIVGSVEFTDPDGSSSEWITDTIQVPDTAIGKNIKVEWRLTTIVTTDYIGWYVDDVRVDAN